MWDIDIEFLVVVGVGVGNKGQKMRDNQALEMSEYYMWNYFTFEKRKEAGKKGKVELLDYNACWITVLPFNYNPLTY